MIENIIYVLTGLLILISLFKMVTHHTIDLISVNYFMICVISTLIAFITYQTYTSMYVNVVKCVKVNNKLYNVYFNIDNIEYIICSEKFYNTGDKITVYKNIVEGTGYYMPTNIQMTVFVSVLVAIVIIKAYFYIRLHNTDFSQQAKLAGAY
jgi:hypothetical protein